MKPQVSLYIKINQLLEAEEMAQELKALPSMAEDLSLFFSCHIRQFTNAGEQDPVLASKGICSRVHILTNIYTDTHN